MASWQPFLQASNVTAAPDATVEACVTEFIASGRPALLTFLKRNNVKSLTDRQRLCNCLSKACRDESLHAAAEAGDCTAARCALLARGNQFIDALGGAGNTTPLMAAVSSGHADCATLLIESSASLEATRSMKLTALMIAAIRGRDECCRLLCDASAAVDAVDEDGWSSLMYAAIHISQQHDECVNILLGAKADASHCKQNGFSCLMAAAVGGSAGSVRALLEGGASLGATSARGWSALTYAKAFHPSDDDGLLLVRDHVRMRASLQLDVAPWESELAALSIFDDMAAAAEEMRSLHQVAAADDASVVAASLASSAVAAALAAVEISDEQQQQPEDGRLFFLASVDGHAHDESWRERPVSSCSPAAAGITYWCGSRFSHDTNVLQVILRAHGVKRVESLELDEWTLCWNTGQAVDLDLLKRLQPHHRVNKFLKSRSVLTQKQKLWSTVRSTQKGAGGEDDYDATFMPTTFILPNEADDLEAWILKERLRWIYKPAAASCGSGIQVHEPPLKRASSGEEDLSQLDGIPPIPPSIRSTRGIASAYLSDPYLVDGKKFDLRLYVLVTSFDPLIAYIHTSGIVRFATEDYNLHKDDLLCERAHICNYAVNKNSETFVKSIGGPSEANGQAGSIWSLSGFKERLEADLRSKDVKWVEKAAKVWAAVDSLILQTLNAAAPAMRASGAVEEEEGSGGSAVTAAAEELDAAQSACCFQLYGFDVMLDANGKPWLLEVNGDPGLRTESPIFLQINAPMVADLLNLIGLSSPSEDDQSRRLSDPSRGARLREAADRRHERQPDRCGGWRRLQ